MIKGKVAVVTGSTSGIGLGIARKLAVGGAHVMLNGFGKADEIETLCRQWSLDFGVRVVHSGADMSQADQVARLIADAQEQLGSVDILVNNAGIQHVAPVDEFPPQKWEQVLSINLSSNFYAIAAALPGMKARGWGRIINVASAHGLVASPYKSAYEPVGLELCGSIPPATCCRLRRPEGRLASARRLNAL
jgi:3-hydroxybutyrate dehydrogenase